MKWILGILKREGKNISEETLRLFLQYTGSDMENISSELDKLLSYTAERNAVTSEDVRTICTVQTTDQIFEMVHAISEKKQRQALDLYYDLLSLKIPPMKILFLIARQFHQLLLVKSLSGKGMDKTGIASRLKIPPFAAARAMTQARGFTTEQLRQAVSDCVEAEEAVKTGRMTDILSVELLIIRYSSYDIAKSGL